MQFNTYLDNKKKLKLIHDTSIREVILEHKTLSRMGRLDTESLLTLTDSALESGLSPVLQWDILCTESNFENCIKLLDDLPLSKFSAIRVQDIELQSGCGMSIRKFLYISLQKQVTII